MGIHFHEHSHVKHNSHEPHSETKLNTAFAIAVFLTLTYSGIEIVYALMANSMSLLADAAHNLGDVLGLGFSWAANWLLSFPAGKRYSYGFKRTTIIASLANAFILVATSAIIAYEAIYKLFNLSAVSENTVIVVGLIGVLINGSSSLLFMRAAKHDLNIKGAFLHLLADALILAGVVVSALIIKFTGYVWIDPVLGLVIVGIVLWGTWGLMRSSMRLILDAVPHYIDQAGVKKYLTELSGVTAIHDLHIWGLSTREVALTVHLVMPDRHLSDSDYKKINHILHEKFNVNHVTIQIEKGSEEDPCARIESC